ncbi:MAG TPA: hypothetical protein VK914_05475 [bacterium]|jgi:hypothetical protein|nr:hypothetical protein [bacterium]
MNQRLPNAFELADMVDRVTREWANLAARPAGLPAPGPANLPLEFSVDFAGPLTLRMVLRCGEDLGAEMAESSTGDPGARALAVDAFREFVNQVAQHWILRRPSTFPRPRKAGLALASEPKGWPQRVPDASVVVMVDAFPLELRLWLLQAADAV